MTTTVHTFNVLLAVNPILKTYIGLLHIECNVYLDLSCNLNEGFLQMYPTSKEKMKVFFWWYPYIHQILPKIDLKFRVCFDFLPKESIWKFDLNRWFMLKAYEIILHHYLAIYKIQGFQLWVDWLNTSLRTPDLAVKKTLTSCKLLKNANLKRKFVWMCVYN